MLNQDQQFGQTSEAIAADYLQRNGYKILVRNYRTKLGEIDLIARDGDTLAFIEVKARRSARYGNPKYAVNRWKQKKISMAALTYLKSTKQMNVRARFDVLAILSTKHPPQIELIKNAFELAYR
ncbi:MAG: YraN family protein [Thermodesulfobacteriota bacterium]